MFEHCDASLPADCLTGATASTGGRPARRNAGFAAATLIGLLGAAGHVAPALAQTPIGGATVVLNDVRSQQSGVRQFSPLAVGDHVFRNDLVRTSPESNAKLVFLDATNMSIGPDSVVKLDDFVYNGDGTARTVVLNVSQGAFRFFSGRSSSGAYTVQTPQAVIGVRGTTYDVRIADGVTLVVLQDGEVEVCVVNTTRCRSLDQQGQSVRVDDTDISEVIPPAEKPWDFAAICGAGDDSLCVQASHFALAPPLPPRRAAAPAAAPRRQTQRPRPAPRAPAQPRIRAAAPPPYYDRPYDPPPYRAPPPYYGGGIIYEDYPGYRRPPRGPRPRPPVVVDPPVRCYPGSRDPRCGYTRPRPRPRPPVVGHPPVRCYPGSHDPRCGVTRPRPRPHPVQPPGFGHPRNPHLPVQPGRGFTPPRQPGWQGGGRPGTGQPGFGRPTGSPQRDFGRGRSFDGAPGRGSRGPAIQNRSGGRGDNRGRGSGF